MLDAPSFFTKIDGEVHHKARYQHLPNLIGIGILPGPEEESEPIFAKLVERNAINIHSPSVQSAVYYLSQDRGQIVEGLRSILRNFYKMSLHSTLLIGSPRGPQSTSHALGTYLLDRLKEKGLSVNKVFIQRSLISKGGIDTLLQALDKADIIILASPLYADSHHSGVIAAMELILARLSDKPRINRQKMVAISNSGFPESSHNDLSLSISRRFALECGFEWAGGIALGGGESIGGQPLERLVGGREMSGSVSNLLPMPWLRVSIYQKVLLHSWRCHSFRDGYTF